MHLSFPKLFISILGFVLVGTPFVAYLWDALNRVMTGHIEGRRLAIAAVAGLFFAVYLRFLIRILWQWETDTSSAGRTRG